MRHQQRGNERDRAARDQEQKMRRGQERAMRDQQRTNERDRATRDQEQQMRRAQERAMRDQQRTNERDRAARDQEQQMRRGQERAMRDQQRANDRDRATRDQEQQMRRGQERAMRDQQRTNERDRAARDQEQQMRRDQERAMRDQEGQMRREQQDRARQERGVREQRGQERARANRPLRTTNARAGGGEAEPAVAALRAISRSVTIGAPRRCRDRRTRSSASRARSPMPSRLPRRSATTGAAVHRGDGPPATASGRDPASECATGASSPSPPLTALAPPERAAHSTSGPAATLDNGLSRTEIGELIHAHGHLRRIPRLPSRRRGSRARCSTNGTPRRAVSGASFYDVPGPLAQLVEHRTFNPRVQGSSP